MDVQSLIYPTDMQSVSQSESPTSEGAKSQNFGLTAAAFDNLQKQLENGDERLFEQVFVTQFRRCTRHLIFRYKARDDDAKDAVMNTLLDFRKLLLARKVNFGNLEGYLIKMVSTNYLKSLQSNVEVQAENFPETTQELHVATFSEEEYTAFARAWSELCEKCRLVLQRYYYDDLPHAQIALLSGKNLAAVKQDKHRCVEKLRKNFLRFNLQF